MKWPRLRHRPTSEGRRARERAEVDLERIKAETKQWEALGDELREIRRRNHLAETFLQATRGRS